MSLNKNNFLRWDGAFTAAPFNLIAGPGSIEYSQGGRLQYEVSLLDYITATYGVDPASIEISNNFSMDYAPTAGIGSMLESTGEVNTGATNWRVTSFIKVQPGDIVQYSGFTSGAAAAICGFDQNLNFVSPSILEQVNYTVLTPVIIPAGITYVRASSRVVSGDAPFQFIAPGDAPTTLPIFSQRRQLLIYYAENKFDFGTKLISYRFKDRAGHQSDWGQITLIIGQRSTRYEGYPPSATCSVVTPGQTIYAQKYLIYEDDNSPVQPVTPISNTGGSETIPPFINYFQCPLDTMTATVTINNNSDITYPSFFSYTIGATTYSYRILMTANSSVIVKVIPGAVDVVTLSGTPVGPQPPHRMIVEQGADPSLIAEWGPIGESGAHVDNANLYDTMQITVEPNY